MAAFFFFLLAARPPLPVNRPPRPRPLPPHRLHTCGRLRRLYRTVRPPPAAGAAPLLPPRPSWRVLVPTDGSGGSYVSPCLEVLGGLGRGGTVLVPFYRGLLIIVSNIF